MRYDGHIRNDLPEVYVTMRFLSKCLSILLIVCLFLPCLSLAEDLAAPAVSAAPEATDAPDASSSPDVTELPQSMFAPFNLVLPEGAHVEITDSRVTLVQNASRVVAIHLSRVADEDPDSAITTLMQEFDSATGETIPFTAEEGFSILGGVVYNAFNEGEDKITLMVLSHDGPLLILSGYNLDKDHHALYLFLTELLAGVTYDQQAVYLPETVVENE